MSGTGSLGISILDDRWARSGCGTTLIDTFRFAAGTSRFGRHAEAALRAGVSALARAPTSGRRIARRSCVASFVLTQHAAIAIRERGISPSWIERTLLAPAWAALDPHDPTLVHAYCPVPERGGRVLRVVYDPTPIP